MIVSFKVPLLNILRLKFSQHSDYHNEGYPTSKPPNMDSTRISTCQIGWIEPRFCNALIFRESTGHQHNHQRLHLSSAQWSWQGRVALRHH